MASNSQGLNRILAQKFGAYHGAQSSDSEEWDDEWSEDEHEETEEVHGQGEQVDVDYENENSWIQDEEEWPNDFASFQNGSTAECPDYIDPVPHDDDSPPEQFAPQIPNKVLPPLPTEQTPSRPARHNKPLPVPPSLESRKPEVSPRSPTGRPIMSPPSHVAGRRTPAQPPANKPKPPTKPKPAFQSEGNNKIAHLAHAFQQQQQQQQQQQEQQPPAVLPPRANKSPHTTQVNGGGFLHNQGVAMHNRMQANASIPQAWKGRKAATPQVQQPRHNNFSEDEEEGDEDYEYIKEPIAHMGIHEDKPSSSPRKPPPLPRQERPAPPPKANTTTNNNKRQHMRQGIPGLLEADTKNLKKAIEMLHKTPPAVFNGININDTNPNFNPNQHRDRKNSTDESSTGRVSHVKKLFSQGAMIMANVSPPGLSTRPALTPPKQALSPPIPNSTGQGVKRRPGLAPPQAQKQISVESSLPRRPLPNPPSLESNSMNMMNGDVSPTIKERELPPLPTQPMQRGPLPPPPPVAEIDGLYSYNWYFGSIEREEANTAVKLMDCDGAFLVRKSTKANLDEPYTLVFSYGNKVRNLKIRRREDEKFSLGTPKPEELAFRNVQELIFYHQKTPIQLTGGIMAVLIKCPNRR